jgi:hypothetical protein
VYTEPTGYAAAFIVAAVGVAACTKAVVANCVVLVPEEAVGAAGTPVNVGASIGALVATPATIAACVNAVVATCVLFVAVAGVGAAGIPVNVGALKLDLVATAVAMFVNSSSISVPLTVLSALPVGKASFDAKLVALV